MAKTEPDAETQNWIGLAQQGGKLTWDWADAAARVAPIGERGRENKTRFLLEQQRKKVMKEMEIRGAPDLHEEVPSVRTLETNREATIIHTDLRDGLSVEAARQFYVLRDDLKGITSILEDMRSNATTLTKSNCQEAVGVYLKERDRKRVTDVQIHEDMKGSLLDIKIIVKREMEVKRKREPEFDEDQTQEILDMIEVIKAQLDFFKVALTGEIEIDWDAELERLGD